MMTTFKGLEIVKDLATHIKPSAQNNCLGNGFGYGNPADYITVHQTGNKSKGANEDMHSRYQKIFRMVNHGTSPLGLKKRFKISILVGNATMRETETGKEIQRQLVLKFVSTKMMIILHKSPTGQKLLLG